MVMPTCSSAWHEWDTQGLAQVTDDGLEETAGLMHFDPAVPGWERLQGQDTWRWSPSLQGSCCDLVL